MREVIVFYIPPIPVNESESMNKDIEKMKGLNPDFCIFVVEDKAREKVEVEVKYRNNT